MFTNIVKKLANIYKVPANLYDHVKFFWVTVSTEHGQTHAELGQVPRSELEAEAYPDWPLGQGALGQVPG